MPADSPRSPWPRLPARLVRIAIALAAALLLALTAATLLPANGSPRLVLLADARFHIGLCAAITLLLALATRAWRSSAALALCALVHLLPAVPGRWFHNRTASEPALRVATVNLWFGNSATSEVEAFLRTPGLDLVAVQEVSPGTVKTLAAVRDVFPHQALHPLTLTHGDNRAFGIGLLSRHRILHHESMHAGAGAFPFVSARVAAPTGDTQVIVLHALPPQVRLGARTELFQRIAEALDPKLPVLVLGDFNATSYAPDLKAFTATTGTLDLCIWAGRQPSWSPYRLPTWIGFDLDRVLTRGFEPLSCTLGPPIGSDHLPVLATLATPRG